MAGGGWGRRLAAGLAAVGLALVLAACQVTTSVSLRVSGDGTGSVEVQVGFDRAAAEAVGGVGQQLQVGDLAAAGWTTATTSRPDGATVVTLTHAFSGLTQVPGLLDEIGASPTGGRAPLFQVRLEQARTFWTTTTTASGAVDLRCGLSCFGDGGLRRAYGSEVGVGTGALGGRAGERAARRDFHFSLRLQLPGHVVAADVPSSGAGLRWTAVLGERTPIAATAHAVNGRRVTEASVAGGAAIVGVVLAAVGIVTAVRRRRGRRRVAAGRPPRATRRPRRRA